MINCIIEISQKDGTSGLEGENKNDDDEGDEDDDEETNHQVEAVTMKF